MLVQTVVQVFLERQLPTGLVRTIAEALGQGELSRRDFDGIVGELPADERSALHDSLLDLIIFAAAQFLADHRLAEDEQAGLLYLKRLFRVQEGDFLNRKEPEVAAIIRTEVKRILEDRAVDPGEALHKVHLQHVFDLSYDQFAELIRPQVHDVLLHLALQIDADRDGVVSEADLQWYHRSLAALDLAYDLNPREEYRDPSAGFVYLLVNPSMERMVKIGKTTRSPHLRARELASATGVPTSFILVFEIYVRDCTAAEEYVHDALEARGCRVSTNREFFRVAPNEAVELMIEAQKVINAT